MLDNDLSRIVINASSCAESSLGEASCEFFAINSSLEVQSRSEAAWRGASPGSSINRASSDPQKRDDVVKGVGRSRRGAKAALGPRLSSSIAGGTLLREMLLHYRNLQISLGPR